MRIVDCDTPFLILEPHSIVNSSTFHLPQVVDSSNVNASTFGGQLPRTDNMSTYFQAFSEGKRTSLHVAEVLNFQDGLNTRATCRARSKGISAIIALAALRADECDDVCRDEQPRPLAFCSE